MSWIIVNNNIHVKASPTDGFLNWKLSGFFITMEYRELELNFI